MERPEIITDKAKQIWKDTRDVRPPRVADLHYTFNFGKYAGWRITDVASIKIGYIFWLVQKNIIILEEDFMDEVIHYCIKCAWKDFPDSEPMERFHRAMDNYRQYSRYLNKPVF